jgi:hypothetical protein
MAYKLPENPPERERLSVAARYFGIDPELYDTPYLRHLVLQTLQQSRRIKIDPGPLVTLARALSDAHRSFFILTARSGRAAIDRAIEFLDLHVLRPQEIFFVGRVAKGRQISLVAKMISAPTPIVYFEDSARHSRNSYAQKLERVETVFLDWPAESPVEAEKIVSEALSWFHNKKHRGEAA